MASHDRSNYDRSLDKLIGGGHTKPGNYEWNSIWFRNRLELPPAASWKLVV